MMRQAELTPDPSPMALEYAQHYLDTGEAKFEAFTAGQSCEVVELHDRRLRVSGVSHMITVEEI